MDAQRKAKLKIGESRRGLMILLTMFGVIPMMVGTLMLWEMLNTQLMQSHQKHLHNSVQTMELIFNGRADELGNSLSRMVSDNTLQITLELEIVPQLLRYLSKHYEISGFDFLKIVKKQPTETVLASFGADIGNDDVGVGGIGETRLRVYGKELYLIATVPVSRDDKELGYILGGVSLSSGAMLGYSKGTIGAYPVIWWKGRAITLNGAEVPVDPPSESFQLFSWNTTDGSSYLGMFKRMTVVGNPLQIGAIIPKAELTEGLRKIAVIVFFLLLLMGSVTYLALRSFIQKWKTEQVLALEQKRALATLSSIGDAVFTIGADDEIEYLNEAACDLLECDQNQIRGKFWHSMFQLIDEETGQPVENPVHQAIRLGGIIRADGNTLLQFADKTTEAQYTAALIDSSDTDCCGVVLVIRDIHEERKLQKDLAWRAARDDLTGLFNRGEFRRRVALAINDATNHGAEHALLFMDLDQFKVLNDSCGHAFGDQVLVQVGDLLQDSLRSSDILARLGGDEFGVLLTGCPMSRAMDIAEHLRKLIKEHRVAYGNKIYEIGVSIGLSAINASSGNVDQLLSSADAACYSAKDEGRDRVRLYVPTEGEKDRRIEEMEWVPQIRQALKEDRFALYSQAIVPINPDLQRHDEILIRMLDERGEIINPGAFIPIAERYGLMPDIDRWVVRNVCRHLTWQLNDRGELPTDDFLFSINLSGASLADSSIPEFIEQQLSEFRIAPRLLCFEVTETIAISNIERAKTLINRLRSLGCSFMLDDFGSGMSSFAYLKHLPVDYLKIDGVFVKDIGSDPMDRAMVKAINEIGHMLGLKTVAEFVENGEILSCLQSLEVDFAQGFGIEKPKPIQGAEQLMANPKKAS